MKLRSPVLLVLPFLVAACGQPAPTASRTVADQVYVLGAGGVAVIDGATGRHTADLPLTVPAPDWKQLYAVRGTQLLILDARGGQVAVVDIPSGYELPQTTFDERPGGLSQNGDYLVLDKFSGGTPPSRSSFLLVDTSTRQIAHRADFDGWFEFDGVDDSGTRLYLIHHFPAQPAKYEVAKYGFATGELQAPIVEKTGKLRVMQGSRVSTLTDPGGHWQYSLYRGGVEGAFIHVLMLDADYGFAWCVDLPGGGTLEQQLAWSIAMSPDGKQLYALNPVLNQALSYDIASTSPGQPPPLHRQGSLVSGSPFGIGASVLSPDRKDLVVAMNGGLLVLDPEHLSVQDRWASSQVFRALAASSDGASIYGLTAAGLVRVDARSGRSSPPLAADGVTILGVRSM